MALFKGSTASLISGKVGGLVYQRNGRIRPYRIPLNPRTALQDAVRLAFIIVTGLWAALDAATQDSWSTWGLTHPKTNRIGDSITMTGKQSYMSLNAPRQLVGLTPIDAAPGLFPLNATPIGPVAGPESTIVAGGSDITVGNLLLGAGYRLSIYVGLPRSSTSRRGRKALTYIGSIPGASTPVTTGSLSLPSGIAVENDVYDVRYVIRGTADFLYSESLETVVVI